MMPLTFCKEVTVDGKPVCHVKLPLVCQPPKTAPAAPFSIRNACRDLHRLGAIVAAPSDQARERHNR